MQHFVIAPDAIQGGTATFPPNQAHQITRVLRLRDGDEVVVLDGIGTQYRVRLAVAGKGVRGEILGPATACYEPAHRVALLVAPPKGERWEWLLQKGTEVGVARFAPVVARYSQPGTAAVKPRHREIVREATEQCRRLLVPPIDEPRPLAEALADPAHRRNGATVLLWEDAGGEGGPGLADLLRIHQPGDEGELRLVIGPEGGFHPEEVALARALSIPLAGLGPLTLRTETAALVAAALALNV